MTIDYRTGGSRAQARRRFLHRLTLLAGGALLAPLFARTAGATNATTAAAGKSARIVVFSGSDASPLADRVNQLGYGWTPVADEAAAHAGVVDRETLAVVGAGAGVAAALRFARSHAGVKAVLVVGMDHGDAIDEFRALQAPRAYAVQVLGAIDAIDWHGASRWLDRHMA